MKILKEDLETGEFQIHFLKMDEEGYINLDKEIIDKLDIKNSNQITGYLINNNLVIPFKNFGKSKEKKDEK